MGVAGTLWGVAAVRERDVSCAGIWGKGHGERARAAIVRLLDPVSTQGGVVDADVLPGTCGGGLRLRWPEEHLAPGGAGWGWRAGGAGAQSAACGLCGGWSGSTSHRAAAARCATA